MKILVNEYGEAFEVVEFSRDDIFLSNAGKVTLIDTDANKYHINDSSVAGKFTPLCKRDH